MFENIMNFFKKFSKKEKPKESSNAAKERLHLVLMQDRANVSADFLELMRQEIIEVIKKYIDIDEKAIDVKLTNKMNEDGTVGAPALYANIPIVTIKNEARKAETQTPQNEKKEDIKQEDQKEEKKQTQENEKTEKVEANKETKPENENVKEEVVEPKEKTVIENKVEEKSSEAKNQESIEEKQVTEEKEQGHTEKQNNKQKVEAN